MKRNATFLSRLWAFLTEPVLSVQDAEDRLHAQWLAAVLVVSLPLGVLVTAAPAMLGLEPSLLADTDLLVYVGSLLFFAVVYALTRLGRTQVAMVLSVVTASCVIFLIAILDFELYKTYYLLLPILFCSVLLPPPTVIAYVAANLLGILALPFFIPGLSRTRLLLEPMSFVGMGATLALLAASQRSRLASQRRARLVESENRFQSIVVQSTDGIALADKEGRIIEWNAAMAEISGLSRDAVAGRALWDVLSGITARAMDAEAVRALRARIQGYQHSPLAGPAPGQVMEQPIIRPDGERRSVLISHFPIVADEGPMFGAFVRDVTERNRAQEALAESEARLRMIVEGTDALLINTDRRGYITYVNAAAAELLGRPPEELVGRLYLRFVHPDDRERILVLYRQQIERRVPSLSQEFRVVAGDETRWVHFVAHPIMRDGRIVEMVGFALDITERRRLEERVRRQERLAAVGQLAAGIAHDFRNLLSTIILYAQLSMSAPDVLPREASRMETIIAESRKAADLVEQILDFSRRSIIQRQPVDLQDLVSDRLRVFRRTIPESIRIAFEVQEPADGNYTVEVDPGRVQQALTNLVLNARDAMPDGGDLTFSLSRMNQVPEPAQHEEDLPADWVCLAVSDTGIGMTPDVRAHIFEPFFTTKGVGQGTGLGLPQVYGIVRQHDGYIDVHAAPGRGTTFSLYFPAHDQVTPEPTPDGTSDLSSGAGETLLLVEDEAHLRQAGRDALVALGYDVVTAVDGREALARCQAARWSAEGDGPIDLVITDLVMPGMGGKAFMRAVRRTRPDLPVIAITGYPLGDDDVEDLRAAGFRAVLTKPIDIQDWGAAIRRALHGIADA